MGNMGYCRFENTVASLLDCIDNWYRVNSESEREAREELVELCKEIVEDYGEEDDSNLIMEYIHNSEDMNE